MRATACTCTSACSTTPALPCCSTPPARPACRSSVGASRPGSSRTRAHSAPSPLSSARLQPHRWSAGAVCLAQRNREALLRIPPLLALAGEGQSHQLRLEYRGADAPANPYLALRAIVRAGPEGVRAQLPVPPILDRDPAGLQGEEAARYGVGALPASLEDALQGLAGDEAVRGWMPPLLYEAYE